jgi:hypothetical protein
MATRAPDAYIRGMQTYLPYALYAVLAVLLAVLAAGVLNLLRTDDKAVSRSNKLMRLRVGVQFLAILVIVAIGWASGAFR